MINFNMTKGNWKKYKLGDFCPLEYGKGLLSKNRQKGQIPVYGSNGINDWHNQAYVKTPGIIIGRKGTAGSVTLSKSSFWPIDTTFFIKDEPKKRNLLFTYYLLKNTNLKALVSDSAVPGLNREAAHALELFIPPLEEQKRIAEILGAFDDKIELLQKQNKTLEEMAKAIFKSWFVDFDIVKAKQKGEKKEDIIKNYHLTEELYNLFPSSFVDSSLGPIPTGWEVKTIQDVAKIFSGKRPNSTQEQKSEFYNIAVYGGNGIKWWTKDPLYNTPIIITGRVGTLGQVYRIYDPVWVSDNALVFETISENFEYLFYSLKNIDFSSFNRGSTQPLITQGDIKNICLVYSKKIIKEFHNIIVEYEKKILLNNKQIQTLTELRDTLLPRLISGKIKV